MNFAGSRNNMKKNVGRDNDDFDRLDSLKDD